MFVIRKEQMEAFNRQALEDFVDRMVAHLQTAVPEQIKNYSPGLLRELIIAGVERAASYDVTDEVDVQRFLEYGVLYGLNFDVAPATAWAGKILRDRRLSGTEKMNQIDDYDLFVNRRQQP